VTCLWAMVAALAVASPFAGRWDLTVTTPAAAYPSWVEVVEQDGAVHVRAQRRGGGVHDAGVRFDGERMLVTVSPASAEAPALIWDLAEQGGVLEGVQKRGDTVEGSIRGLRAPALQRSAPAAWGAPFPLFNGKDLAGWTSVNNTGDAGASDNHWVVKGGVLRNETKGQNLVSTRRFMDFKLHVEFNLDSEANSGIYLRGRYECQLPPPASPRDWAIYGFLPASRLARAKPGQWRTYDITLVGRSVTLVLDGITIVDQREIPGITGGALDSHEAEPGPICFQGDHTGGIRIRNVRIALPRDSSFKDQVRY
jgi:hypothetical protein